MKKTRAIIIILLIISIQKPVYPRFGFSLMYSPLTFIKYADMGMSVGANFFFDNTLLNKTSVRVNISGEYIFYSYEEYVETGGIASLPGIPSLPDGLPGTVKKTQLVSDFSDGYSIGICGEFVKEYGGYYYSFGAGFGLGITLSMIDDDFTGSASIKFPFRISYPINRNGVKMYIEVMPTLNVPIVYTKATNFFDASGYVSFPISVGFKF